MYIKSIAFLDNNSNLIKSYKIMSLPITEACILNKCIEFFSDPEPCFIHRSAVMKRIITEIDDYFYNMFKQGINEINWSAFPERFKEALETVSNVDSIRFII